MAENLNGEHRIPVAAAYAEGFGKDKFFHFSIMYFLFGAACLVFPLAIFFMPLFAYFKGLKKYPRAQKRPANQSSTVTLIDGSGDAADDAPADTPASAEPADVSVMVAGFETRWILLTHFVLVFVVWVMPIDMFSKLMTVFLHAINFLFYVMYFGSFSFSLVAKARVVSPAGYRVGRLIVFCLTVGAAMLAVLAVDYFWLAGAARLWLVEAVATQAEGIRTFMLESGRSPYQLPANIVLLLEQGARPWAEQMMVAMPLGMFSIAMVVYLFYWALFDSRCLKSKERIYTYFQVPDWGMVIVALWLILYVVFILLQPFPEKAQYISLFLTLALTASLAAYGFEGFSIIMRRGSRVRFFWVFFMIGAVVFFSAKAAFIFLMSLGVVAQILRFLPIKIPRLPSR